MLVNRVSEMRAGRQQQPMESRCRSSSVVGGVCEKVLLVDLTMSLRAWLGMSVAAGSMQAALYLRGKQRQRARAAARSRRFELPSNVATRDIAPFPEYPPVAWVRQYSRHTLTHQSSHPRFFSANQKTTHPNLQLTTSTSHEINIHPRNFSPN